MKSSFISKKNISGNIWTFNFKRPDSYEFIAGQFLELGIYDSENNFQKRWFTISSSPENQKLLSITTRIIQNKASSYKLLLSSLKTGETVNISDSLGDFVLPKSSNLKLLFIGIGIGVTPFISILNYLTDLDQERSIDVVYIKSKNEQNLIHKKLFLTKCKNLIECDYAENKIFIKQINNLLKDKDLFYISGPEKKVSIIKNILLGIGVKSNKIITDNFLGY